MDIIIEHDIENKQFISEVDGRISHLSYDVLPESNTLNYLSTYVPPELRGRQIGRKIIKFALDYAKENNFKIIPTCSFVRAYIENHPEYDDIVV